MMIGRISLIVAQIAMFMLAATNVANAATVRVTGTITETSPGTCGQPVWTGAVGTIRCIGLEETWEGGISGTGVFDEAISFNVGSGELHVSGTETFVGCVGRSCGTLEWAYQGSGKLDLQSFSVISIDGVQHFTGGTGGLAGAKGWVSFSLVGEGPATYRGLVVL